MKTQKHTHGFKVPEDYFGNFETALFSKIEEDTLPKSTGFEVPEGYFKNLDAKVLKSVLDSENEPKVISLWNKTTLGYIAAIAACVVFIVSIFINTNNTNLIQLQDSAVSTYIEDGNLDFSTLDVVALLDDVEITNIELQTSLFSEEKIEDYLLEDIDDTVDLIDFE